MEVMKHVVTTSVTGHFFSLAVPLNALQYRHAVPHQHAVPLFFSLYSLPPGTSASTHLSTDAQFSADTQPGTDATRTQYWRRAIQDDLYYRPEDRTRSRVGAYRGQYQVVLRSLETLTFIFEMKAPTSPPIAPVVPRPP
eukprot:2832315-Rhodomonas_salina.1